MEAGGDMGQNEGQRMKAKGCRKKRWEGSSKEEMVKDKDIYWVGEEGTRRSRREEKG